MRARLRITVTPSCQSDGMEMNICSLAPYFSDEAAAWGLLESLRWPNGPECPHCGEVDRATYLKPRDGQRTTSTGKVSYRRLWKCQACKRKFSVLVGSIFEDSKVPLSKWLMAFYLLTASKNGVAAYELHRTLGVTNKTAWFMFHRIREAMKAGPLADMLRGTIVADETYIGGDPRRMNATTRARWEQRRDTPFNGREGRSDKAAILSLINAESGVVRSQVVPRVDGSNLRKAMSEQVDMAGSRLWTDEGSWYRHIGQEFIEHATVNHNEKQYKGAQGQTTNQAESYFSQLKRSLDGTHHRVSKEHLPRYLAEHDFRYSTRQLSDSDRMVQLMGQTGGRRLTYRTVKAGRSIK